jgi:hypothetical protein
VGVPFLPGRPSLVDHIGSRLGWFETAEQPFIYVAFILVRWPDGNQR